MDAKDLYEPIKSKIEAWIWYEENKPKSEYECNPNEHDEFRKKHDLDCILTNGNLRADTIFSLWLPLRFVLVRINGYGKLNKLGNINDKDTFLKKLSKVGVLEQLLPIENLTVIKLSKLFYLGQKRSNVMILQMRWLQSRGLKPCYDYMPYFLYECFDDGIFSKAFGSNDKLIRWINDESLEVFFDGAVVKDNIRDLSDSGSLKNGIPKDIDFLIQNYIGILERRKV